MKIKQNILREAVNKAVREIVSEQKNERTLDMIIESVVSNQLMMLNEDNKSTKTDSKKRKKRAVIQWLQQPEIDKAEIRRQLEGEPENQAEEDAKRSYFMKKVNQSYGKDFTDEEVNRLYSLKTSLGQ